MTLNDDDALRVYVQKAFWFPPHSMCGIPLASPDGLLRQEKD